MRRTSPHPSAVCTQAAELQHLSFFSYHYSAVLSLNCFVSVKFYGILWTIFAAWKLILMFSFHALLITISQHLTIPMHNVLIYLYIYINFTLLLSAAQSFLGS
jgi:hypothetical protein